MKFEQVVERLGHARTWSEAMTAIRERNPGRGAASAYIAEQHGVSRRTAQKWLAGTQSPASRTQQGRNLKQNVIGGAPTSRAVAAQRLRNAKTIHVGGISVYYRPDGYGIGASEGHRAVGGDHSTAGMFGVAINRAANAIESNDPNAREALEAAILGEYVATSGGRWGDVDDSYILGIDEYDDFQAY